ncbi:hypothetical protein [Pseudoalteromonas tunicata]|uniref:hypothetical protein n=1 Tax=Pseudoalteromonas tunicata TaxID=314281 RepID=UPI0022B6E9A1|nr:hypothetical protein [Pseudoalteromonas tunicata]
MLVQIGISSVAEFIQVDPFLLYEQLKSAGHTVSLNLLYAMLVHNKVAIGK